MAACNVPLLALGLVLSAAAALAAPSASTTSTKTPYTKPTDIPDVMPTSCAERPAKNDYLMIVSPTTCRKFIVCDDYRETEMDCPDGLFFNYREQLCDYPGKSGCVEPTTPGIIVVTTEATEATREELGQSADAERGAQDAAQDAAPNNVEPVLGSELEVVDSVEADAQESEGN